MCVFPSASLISLFVGISTPSRAPRKRFSFLRMASVPTRFCIAQRSAVERVRSLYRPAAASEASHSSRCCLSMWPSCGACCSTPSPPLTVLTAPRNTLVRLSFVRTPALSDCL
eukprot:7195248-Prymnesium_polylepis.1